MPPFLKGRHLAGPRSTRDTLLIPANNSQVSSVLLTNLIKIAHPPFNEWQLNCGAVEVTTFPQAIFTDRHAQLVLMCLQPGEEIGDQVHANVDQFFRIQQGEAKFVLNEKKELLERDGSAVVVPAGTYHNVINTSKTTQLKLYTIYSPPNHPDGTVHKTKADADASEAAAHHT